MAELLLLLALPGTPSTSKHFGLQIPLVDSDAAAAEFHAVEHHVVGSRAHLAEFTLFQQRHVFGSFGRVKGWCTAPHLLSSALKASSGKSTTQRKFSSSGSRR